jgi:hypothetical protein
MTLSEFLNILSAPNQLFPSYRLAMRRQRQEHRKKLREIIDALCLDDPDERLLDMIERNPEKLIALGERLKTMQAKGHKRGPKPDVSETLHAVAMKIAWERSRLNQSLFVDEISRIKAPWNEQPISFSLSTLERLFRRSKREYLEDEDLEQAQAMADEIIKRIKALPNSLLGQLI